MSIKLNDAQTPNVCAMLISVALCCSHSRYHHYAEGRMQGIVDAGVAMTPLAY